MIEGDGNGLLATEDARGAGKGRALGRDHTHVPYSPLPGQQGTY